MYRVSPRTVLLLASSLGWCVLAPALARAQDAEGRLGSIEKQIQSLQAELRQMKHEMAARAQEAREAQAQAARSQAAANRATITAMPAIPPGYALVQSAPGATPGTVVLAKTEAPEEPKLPLGTFRLGNVQVTLGGFIEAAGIFRTRNEVADIASSFGSGIALPNSPNYHQSEFRETARQSRISGLVTANPDDVTKLAAYAETDFLSAAPTANSNESNSYNLRLRQAYATYDRTDIGFEVLAGQAWSLLTMTKTGIVPRTENLPLTIDAQYNVGFTWTRQPQFRVVKSFDNGTFWLAGSIESPQTNYYTGPNGLAPSSFGTINVNNPGGSGYAPTNNYSDDIAPDFIVKGAADLGPVHAEAYGLLRIMHDRVSDTGAGANKNVTAGGGGADALVHLIPKFLDVQASFLVGDGIGRYGSAQLPDAVVGRDGQPVPIPEIEALVGVVAHPVPSVDIYGYAGTEQEKAKYFTEAKKGYGYGSPLYDNTSCDVELGASSSCVGNTEGVIEGSAGFWWRFIHGPYGTMQTGVQYSYINRMIFQGQGPTPKTNENQLMFSFRYYPFQ
jgi:hypothetical protein